MGADFDAVGARAEAGPLPRRRRASSSSASPTSRRPSTRFAEQAARYLGAARPRRTPRSPSRAPSSRRATGSWCWENNRECYHCAGNHPSLMPDLPRGPRLSARRARRATSAGARPAHRALRAGRGAVRLPAWTRGASGASCACRCSARPRATRWTARRRSPGRTRHAAVQGRRRAAPLPLSLHLEPLPRRPRDRLPRHCRSARPRPRSAPSGWCTRMRRRASTTTSSG